MKRATESDTGGSMSNTERDAEREAWFLCTKTMLGRCNDGRMRPWWGTDGHSGRERFYTCDRCGATS